MPEFNFHAPIISPSGWGHLLQVPADIAESMIAAEGRRVLITLNDQHSWHAAIMRHGEYGHYIMVSKKNIAAAEVEVDAPVTVELAPDPSRYGVEVPEEFDAVLETDPAGKRAFEELTDGGKRSVIHMVKRYKTTDSRIEKALDLMEKLKVGITDRKILSKKGF